MSDLMQRIQQAAKADAHLIQQWRRHMHAHPELSFQEVNTQAYVIEQLKKAGITQIEPIANTGVLAIIKGNNPDSRIIALRGDMDALPITELNEVDYKSVNSGVMHACGHDVHTSCLLGAAKILHDLKHEWEGTIKLLFQPGEEKNPGGASLLINEGVLENPGPQHIIALHVHPQLEVGKVSFAPGKVMASADEIYINIKSKGGHAARPHLTADTILTASQLVMALQQVVSRNNNPFSPSVLSICSIQGGHTTNVIPSEVKLMGTFRAMDETWRFAAHERIKDICRHTAESTGAEINVRIDVGYPSVINDAVLTPKTKQLATAYMGEQEVGEMELSMGAEDFGYYSQKIPGCFFRLGTGNLSKGISSGVHTPTFDIDEKGIEIGMGLMAWLGALSK